MAVEVREVSAVSSRFPRVLLLHPRMGRRAAVLTTHPGDKQEPLEGVGPAQAEWEPLSSDTLPPLDDVTATNIPSHCNTSPMFAAHFSVTRSSKHC